ncbi:MAG: DUF3127 domain-containing protein [Akkermansiaceae bacterium]
MNTTFALEGVIDKIGDVISKGNGFQKQEVLITEPGKYPNTNKFEFIKDKMGLLQGFAQGDHVRVAGFVKGNEYKGNYYSNLQVWQLEKLNSAAPVASAPQDSAPTPFG